MSGAVLSFARALGEFGATITFAGSLQGVTRTLPLEIYLRRETDADAAVALSLVLVVVAIVVIGFARQGRTALMTLRVLGRPWTSAGSTSPSPSPTARRWRCSGRTVPGSPPCSRWPPACCAPTEGRVVLDGRPLTVVGDGARQAWVAPHDRHIALLAQDPLLFPHLTVLDNVGVRSAQPRRTPGRGARDRHGTGWSRSESPSSPTASRRRSPAVRPSGSPWPARSPPIHGCCCSTSRWPRSTSPSRRRCARPCAGSWPTAAWCW